LTTTIDPSSDTGSSDASATGEPGTSSVFTDASVLGGVSASTNDVQKTTKSPGTDMTGGQANSGSSSIGGTGMHSTPVPQTPPSANPTTNVPGAHTNPTNGGNGNTATGSSALVSLNTGDSSTEKTNNPSVTPSQTGATGTTPVTPSTSTTSLPEKMKQYSFIIGTNATLSPNQMDQSILINMTKTVEVLFDTQLVEVEVKKITTSLAKAVNTKNYTIILDILLRSKSSTCNQACIDGSQKNSKISNVVLKSEDGATVTTDVLTPFDEVGKEPITPTPPPRTGESSPGLAARLGMGLGISFLGVLLIGEIAFFVWRSHSTKSHRSAAYANTT